MSDLIQAAKLFAISNCHRIPMGSNPVLQSPEVHLKSVAQIVSSVSQDANMIAAAWLHDILEDTGVTINEVERRFGTTIAGIVDELTLLSHGASGSRAVRLALAKEHLADVSAGAKTVALADIIDTSRYLYKNRLAALTEYAAEAKELAHVLEGGNERLVGRLRRDLERYTSGSPPAEPAKPVPRFKPIAIPVAALRGFEHSCTAQDIAEPLISFDFKCTTNELIEGMTVAGVKVAGLQRDGILWGFVEAARLREGNSEANRRKFRSSQVVVAGSSIIDVIEVLTRHDWCFVCLLGTVVGAISRDDLHKPAVRMWLFGIITMAEIEFTERIRRKWPGESWSKLLSQQRMASARKLFAERGHSGGECQLVDCLQLGDKLEIMVSDSSELAALGIPSINAARRISRRIERLRNHLAHAQDFVEEDWPQIIRFARRVRQMLDESYHERLMVELEATHERFLAEAKERASAEHELVRSKREAQERLRLLNERLLLALEASHSGTFEWHIKKNLNHWDPLLEKLHGFEPGTYPNTYEAWRESVHSEDIAQFEETVKESLKTGFLSAQWRIRSKNDGQVRSMLAHGRVYFDRERKPEVLIGIVVDVTEQKRAEAQIRTAEKLAVAGRLAQSIEHKITDPLAAITNLVYLIGRDTCLGEATRQLAESAESELAKVARAMALTLRFAYTSSHPGSVDLREISDSVIELFRTRFESSHISVERDYCTKATLNGYPGELQNVIATIVGNAQDAMRGGGKLKIRLREARLWNDTHVRGLRLTVADTGTGIDRDLKHRLFEPFFTTKEETGAGLGLWMSNEIVRKHKGHIAFRTSTDPRHPGTVFRLFFPFQHFLSAKVTTGSSGLGSPLSSGRIVG
jgi:PAS domain S-box-containing protein